MFNSQDEILLLKEMGGDISFALDAMKTDAEHRLAEEKIEKQNERLTILRKIDVAILSADSLENIVSAALDHIRELIDCRRANVTLIDRITNELVIFEVSTVGETSIPAGRRLPLAQFEDIIQTLSQNQPVVFNDYRTMADPRPGVQSLIKDGLLSTCSLPLLSKNGLIGMFSMHSDIPGFFDEGKIALGSEIANQVTIAIVQMQLTEALAKNEERLRLSLHAARQGLYDLNVQTGESIVNREYAEMLGYDLESFTETNAAWIERLHPDDKAVTAKAYTDYINGLLPEYRVEFRQKTRQGDWKWILSLGSIVEYDTEGKPLRMMGTHTDINEHKEAEKQVVQMKRLYATLSQVNQTIVRVKDHAELYQSICDVSTKFGEFALAWIGLLNEETGEIKPVAASGLDLAQWPYQQINIHEGTFKNGLVATAVQTSMVITSEDLMSDERTRSSADSIPNNNYHAAAVVPFQLRGKTIGVLNLISHETELFKAQDELLLLKEMGGDISFALDTMETETEGKLVEDALKESEARFSKVFFTNPVAQSILSTISGQTVEVNDACCRLYEYSREELIGTDSETLNLWANPAERLEVLEELQRTGRLLPREVTIRPKSDEIRTILFSVEQISWKGEPCLVTSSVDISERKLAEEALSEREQKLNTILNLLPVGISILDQDRKVAYSNDALGKILGTTKEGLSSGKYRNRKYLRADGSEKPAEEFASSRVFAEKTALYDIITGIVKEDAQTVWTNVSAVPVDFPDWKIVLVTSDITERTQAEHEIQRQIQRLKGLHTIDQAINSSMEMESTLNIILQQTLDLLHADAASILLFNDSQHRLDYASGKGFRSASASQTQVHIGEGLAGQVGLSRELLHIPDLSKVGGKFLRAELIIEDQFVEYFGVPLIAKDSLKGVLEIFNRTPLNSDSEWLNFLEILGGQTAIAIDNSLLFEGLQRSNTELEQRVEQRTSDLLRVNAELEHANRAKDEFLASMSHELRTPLTGILGLTESLLLSTYGKPNEKQSNALINIEASGRHLLELINDILDLAKIESNKFDIYPELLNIEEVCRASLIFVKEQAIKKSILLEYQEAKGVKTLFADSRRLKQILVNLLSNAVKFTPEKGKVTLAVRTDPEKGQIHFSVSDTGIGIAKEDLDRLFTPFTQVDSRLNRQYEGTGLGLVLVLRLAEMHGGNVQVETEPGKGSCFTVSLPWQAQVSVPAETTQTDSEAPVTSAPNSQGLILLVEDNPSNIEALGDYLQFKGYTVVVASNGVEALIKAEEINPTLILMDIQMPVMDGLEAMRRLRTDPRFTSTPIIALTALAMTGDRERCFEAGATDYLSKPVSLKELYEKVKKLLQQ
ncbi:MAG: GAF domain-containing protein [Anaerolineales bacterium]